MNIVVSWRPEPFFRRPPLAALRNLIRRTAELAGSGFGEQETLSVFFLSEQRMKYANETYLGHHGVTDVICYDYRAAFPSADTGFPPTSEDSCDAVPEAMDSPEESGPTVAADLLVCPAVARREALKRSLPFSRELALYLAHGLLHAAGYDDLQPRLKRRMRAAERRVLRGLPDAETFFAPPDEAAAAAAALRESSRRKGTR